MSDTDTDTDRALLEAAALLFSTPRKRGELAGDGMPCPNDHDPDCRWPFCLCREQAAAMDKEQTRC